MPTPPQWTAERTISVRDVAELVEVFAPHLTGKPIVALAEGWDNAVFVVGGRWALRFPRRAVALPGILREIAVLPAIAPGLPLDVPVPELVGNDLHPSDPWPFTGARLIVGQELAEADPPDTARNAIAAALGGFLRTLHNPAARDAAVATGTDLAVDPMQRGWPRSRLTQTRDDLQRVVASGAWDGNPATTALLDRAGELAPPPTEPVLVHGDLHVRHILVNDHGAATGVIDWGDLCLADPSVDLAIAYAAFDETARDALLTTYGPISGDTELRARAFAVRISVLLAGYAIRDHRPRLLREALRGLDRASG